jgi:hypothetical protein
VQRIPRYELLLRDLLRITPPDHPDHDNLQAALDKVKVIASYINESKRVADRAERMHELTTNVYDRSRRTPFSGKTTVVRPPPTFPHRFDFL